MYQYVWEIQSEYKGLNSVEFWLFSVWMDKTYYTQKDPVVFTFLRTKGVKWVLTIIFENIMFIKKILKLCAQFLQNFYSEL